MTHCKKQSKTDLNYSIIYFLKNLKCNLSRLMNNTFNNKTLKKMKINWWTAHNLTLISFNVISKLIKHTTGTTDYCKIEQIKGTKEVQVKLLMEGYRKQVAVHSGKLIGVDSNSWIQAECCRLNSSHSSLEFTFLADFFLILRRTSLSISPSGISSHLILSTPWRPLGIRGKFGVCNASISLSE